MGHPGKKAQDRALREALNGAAMFISADTFLLLYFLVYSLFFLVFGRLEVYKSCVCLCWTVSLTSF